MADRVRIVARVSPNSFNAFLGKLDGESEKLKHYSRELAKTLAEKTAERAQDSFANAKYDGVNDAEVRVYLDKRNRYTVRAEGESVAFIEYGAGVSHQKDYPGNKPARFAGIGKYGKKYGKRPGWRFEMRPGVTLNSDGSVYEGKRIYGGRNPEKQEYRIANWGKGFRVSGNPNSPYYFMKFGLHSASVGSVVRNTPIIPNEDKNSPFYYEKIKGGVRKRDIGKRLLKTVKTGKQWVYTRGNPPNACMYKSFEATAGEFNTILQEVKK